MFIPLRFAVRNINPTPRVKNWRGKLVNIGVTDVLGGILTDARPPPQLRLGIANSSEIFVWNRDTFKMRDRLVKTTERNLRAQLACTGRNRGVGRLV